MNILITGGTGFVGGHLVKALIKQNHQVTILTRDASKYNQNKSLPVNYISWNPEKDLAPKNAFVNGQGEKIVDVVINLMGENISNRRWSTAQKKKIFNSRILGTKNLVSAIEKYLPSNLDLFISTSAIGLYEANTDIELNEDGIMGKGFLPNVCQEWESATNTLSKTNRKLIARVGVVFGNNGGALQKLLPIFKLGGGGPIGNGKQVMSWIHVADLVNIFIKAISNENYKGVVNAVSPNAISNTEFTKAFARAVHRPAFFPVPPFMLRLIFGEMASIILDSQIVRPKALTSLGHQFLYPGIQEAMDEVCQNVNLIGLPKSYNTLETAQFFEKKK